MELILGVQHGVSLQIPDLADTEAKFQEEMEKFLQRNASNRLLLHIDEHRSMSTSPEFRRGALLLAGSLPQMCQVIATYLEPPDLAAQGSSQVCRFPIAMMLVDVSPLLTRDASDAAPATAAGLPRIKLPVEGWGGKEERLLATLRVKLSLLLVHIGLDQLHIPQDEKSDLRRTFRNIQDQLDKEGNLESKLIGALGSFSVALPDLDEQVSGAVDFLLGIKDARAEDRRYPGVISLDNRKLTLPLDWLMAVRDARDKASSVFKKAQEVFRSSLMESGSWCDGMLLERAYLWVLACKTAKAEDGFGFVSKPRIYEFQCKEIRDGLQQVDGKNARVFTKKGYPCIDGIRCIEDGVMYHALSEGGTAGTAGTHKGFDIWFKTEADELVLSSVGRLNVLQTNSIPSFQSLFACVCMFCNLAGALGCDWSYECRNLQQKGFKYCSECERSEAHGAERGIAGKISNWRSSCSKLQQSHCGCTSSSSSGRRRSKRHIRRLATTPNLAWWWCRLSTLRTGLEWSASHPIFPWTSRIFPLGNFIFPKLQLSPSAVWKLDPKSGVVLWSQCCIRSVLTKPKTLMSCSPFLICRCCVAKWTGHQHIQRPS